MDILDHRIQQAHDAAARNEATDTEWLMLILDRQCGKLDSIQTKVESLLWTRRQIAAVIAAGAGLLSALAIAIRAFF